MSQSLSSSAEQVARARYFMEGEDWEKCTYRVSETVSSIEKDSNKYKELFHKMIYEMDFIPGGRILRNAGRAKGNCFNCFNIPVNDSREEIGEYLKNCLITWGTGGGCGTNWSAIRPKNSIIVTSGGTASGPVSFLEAADAVASTIESGGQRRSAAIASLDITHPDIIDFIDAKLVHGKLSHFNISVNINNDFLVAVEADSEVELIFNQQVYKKVKARVLWNKILENMLNHAEPGLLNTSNLYKNNSYYYANVTCTNPCGELPLEPNAACVLGSLILPNYISDTGKIHWKKLEDIIKLSVRFLDNVIDITSYELKPIDIAVHKSRRIGLGCAGLAEFLFMKKIRYGSEEAVTEVERLVKFIRNITYQTLVELSTEKGSFPAFDAIAYGKASFIRKLPPPLRSDIKKYGSRCVTALSWAPTGTISLLPEVSSGCEPLFARAYKRKDRVSTRIYIHPMYKKLIKESNLIENSKLPEWLVDSFDLKPQDHLEIQSIITKYIDSAVSKSINLPKETTIDQLSSLLLEYIYDLKGVTVYRDGSREGQVLNKISHEEVLKAIKLGKGVDEGMPEEATKCATGSCEI